MVKSNGRAPTTHGSVGVAEQIQSNLSKPKSCKKRQFKGVRMRSWGSWVSEIRAPNQKTRIWLGSYATPEAAARAYDAALLCLKGSSANLNFPITTSTHFPNTLMSPKSIQRVAAAAAAAASTNIATPPSSPTPTLPPYSSSSSSPSDDCGEISRPCSENYSASKAEDPPCSVDPWIDLGGLLSPKYADQMLDPCALFAPPTMEECDEEGGVDLWTFY